MDRFLSIVFGTFTLLCLFGGFGCIYFAIWTDVDAKQIEHTAITTLFLGIVSFILCAMISPTDSRK